MNTKLLLIIIFIGLSNAWGQEFTLTTTSSNTTASKATINMPGLAGNPQAIITATPVGNAAAVDPHPIGAWYYNAKWNIFNTDHANMPIGLSYKLSVFLEPSADHFLHIVTRENVSESASYIDNPALNNNPNAQFQILQNYAPDNRAPYNLNASEARASYNSTSGKWYIANVNGKPLNPNTAYNIVVGGVKDPSIRPLPVPATTREPVTSAAIPPVSTVPPSTSEAIASLPGTSMCTDAMARETVGKWGRQKKDDLAMADRNFPKDQYKAVLAKAQNVIDLFMQASPEFKGIEASAKRDIRGDSYLPNGALPFGIEIHYGSYVCIKNDSPKVESRGKIILSGAYGYTTVYFNSLRDVLESVQDGSPFLTPDGDEVFEYRKQLGDFKGFAMIQPRIREDGHDAIIITSVPGRLPYKALTREQYILARIKNYQLLGGFASEIAILTNALGNMSSADRQGPAIVRDITASPGRARLFVPESEGGRHLVIVDKSFFDPNLPRDAIQFITVRWNWNGKDLPKADAIEQFKQTFQFEALRKMLGK